MIWFQQQQLTTSTIVMLLLVYIIQMYFGQLIIGIIMERLAGLGGVKKKLRTFIRL